MSSHWSTSYIGIPYRLGGRERDGLDCWGLVRLFYFEQRGIALPSLPGIVEDSALTISRQIERESQSNWIETAKPLEGCAVAMSQRKVLHHVGIWTDADGGLVIHAWEKTWVVAETLKSLRLKGIRVIKFFYYGLHH